MKTLELLLAFLRPGVDEPDPDDKPEDVKPAEELPDDLPDDVAPAEDLPADKPDDVKSPEADAALAEIRAEKQRGDRLERELAEIRTRQAPRVDEITQQEEERLRDPKATDLEKWQIQANRELRRGRSEAQFALAQAQDISDKTNFSRIAVTKPALYNRYEARVEKQLSEMRAKGFNASREQIMHNLIGQDMVAGKFAKKAPAKGAEEKTAVPRGKLPGARSDVSGKNAMSEHEKRRQRLENVQI